MDEKKHIYLINSITYHLYVWISFKFSDFYIFFFYKTNTTKKQNVNFQIFYKNAYWNDGVLTFCKCLYSFLINSNDSLFSFDSNFCAFLLFAYKIRNVCFLFESKLKFLLDNHQKQVAVNTEYFVHRATNAYIFHLIILRI